MHCILKRGGGTWKRVGTRKGIGGRDQGTRNGVGTRDKGARALIGCYMGVGQALFEGGECCLGAGGIVWGLWASFGGGWHCLKAGALFGAEGVVWRQGVSYWGGGRHLGVVGIV